MRIFCVGNCNVRQDASEVSLKGVCKLPIWTHNPSARAMESLMNPSANGWANTTEQFAYKTDAEAYAKMSQAVNPYGDGMACPRIADALK